ncbi:hypothetical protein KA107_02705 [Candidatus Pacearchaeota archaeon]|nr:hypothetical protein [Candidatus Pacearchaeota archaeon]
MNKTKPGDTQEILLEAEQIVNGSLTSNLTNTQGKSNNYELSSQDLESLKNRGYSIIERVGEGHTRNAYRVQVEKGNVKRTLIMKIPKREVDANSVCTLINRSKGDLDQREVSVVNQLVHPNIIRVFDSFNLNDGRTVNVEDDIQGTDLETLVKISGPIRSPEVVRKIGTQLFDALDYAHNLHVDNDSFSGVLHRDVKPSNWYMKKDGTGMLGDWQNAAKIRSIEETIMPTRGGTQHTLPFLLNSLLSGNPSCASERSEVYSAASTLYYALTGKDAFDYKIVKSDSGREIEVGKEKFKVELKTEGNDSSGIITTEMHEEKLKKALKELPARYRSFFKRALTLDGKKSFKTSSQALTYWNKVNDSSWLKLKENLVQGVKYAVPAVLAAGVVGLVTYSIATKDPETKPTMREIMATQDYCKFSLDDKLTADSPEWRFNAENIVERGKYAQKHLAEAELKFEKEWGGNLNTFATFSAQSHRMDPRLVLSLVRACYLCDSTNLLPVYTREGQTRLGGLLVPERFMQSILHMGVTILETLEHK